MERKRAFLEVSRLSKTFNPKKLTRVQALKDISFSLAPGGTTALVGPDGAGKTTLLRIIAGLMQPDQGALCFNEARQLKLGYMPQQFGLYEDLSVAENMELYADLHSLPVDKRKARYQELLAMAGLAPFSARMAGQLSGGMKQKLGLICTLLASPNLLLLDEPTVGVDPLSRLELWEIIHKLTRKENTSVIISTAYMDEAARCDQVVLLFAGRTLALGAPDEIRKLSLGMSFMATPAAGDTPRAMQARLLDAEGIIDAIPRGGEVRLVREKQNEQQESRLNPALRNAALKPVDPDLEDSFMLLLRSHLPQAARPQPTHEANAHPAPVAGRHKPVIETRNVSRFFGDFAAVDNVSFSVYQGEVFGLLGPNGAGKTTTFRMLCGLLPPSRGSLFVYGVNVSQAPQEARRHLGYVAQKFSLYGQLTVKENLDFFAGAYGVEDKNRRIEEISREFGLSPHMHMAAGALPGGYKQRLAMAIGLLHRPAILFLDEPTSGADPLARRDFWKRISHLADSGTTIVVTTHFMEEAEYCDRVLIQDNGAMLALDTPANIRKMADTTKDGRPATMEDAFIGIVQKARKRAP